MNKQVTITLPPPPLCAPHAGNFVHAGEDVIIDLQNGEQLIGSLEDFRMTRGEVAVATTVGMEPTVVELASVKTVRLPYPRDWIPPKTSDRQDGLVDRPPRDRLDFRIRLKDGEVMSGDTLGFCTDHNGIYLFPVEGDRHYTYTFVAHNVIEERRIGPRIGEILVEDKVVTQKQVDDALQKQEERRNVPIGEYLRSKAIVSTEELEHALDRQRVVPNMKLGEILISEGLITHDQLHDALEQQKKDRKIPLGQILMQQGLVTSTQIQQCLAKKLGIPFVDLKQFPISDEVLKLVPPALARKHRLIPLYLYRNKLVVVVENPMHWEPLDAIRFHTKLFTEPVMASIDDIDEALTRLYSEDELENFSIDDIEDAEAEYREPDVEEELAVNDNVVVKLVNKIIVGAHKRQASDIHIEPHTDDAKTLVRIRKDGTLLNYLEAPGTMRNAIVSRIKILAGLDISERRKPQDGKIDFRRPGKPRIELRVAVLPTVGGQEDVVMRILPGGEPIRIEQLGLSGRNKNLMMELISRPYGLFFVCGPTGSGKTTTLHSILGFLNQSDRKIWTAEDPVEIRQDGLRQLQVLPKIGLNFANAMRAFLRADPDIIMVGEMRDKETTKIGIEASLTGHMVFSTLHTNSAAESVIRLLDIGMDPFSFADALNGVLAQRLAKRLCINCRRGHDATADEINSLLREYCLELLSREDQESESIQPDAVLQYWREEFADDDGRFTLYEPVGCPECDDTGYSGRFGIHELLLATDEIRTCILEKAQVSEILAVALRQGMRTLRQDGIEKVLQGLTDMPQIRRVCIR